MKKLFLYLLKSYTHTEKGRLEVYKILNEQTTKEYSEQTVPGNFYNAQLEFLMSNEYVNKLIKENDTKWLSVAKNCVNQAFIDLQNNEISEF